MHELVSALHTRMLVYRVYHDGESLPGNGAGSENALDVCCSTKQNIAVLRRVARVASREVDGLVWISERVVKEC
jgi:hypothetical protein